MKLKKMILMKDQKLKELNLKIYQNIKIVEI